MSAGDKKNPPSVLPNKNLTVACGKSCGWLCDSYTKVKTSAIHHHGQNKGWTQWTKNADLALSYQLAWKTTTWNRKQGYMVSSFLQTEEKNQYLFI